MIDRKPLAPVLINPAASATGVAQRPQLRWRDPGKGTFREATKFLVELTDSSIPSFSAWRASISSSSAIRTARC